jgi:hypothetical protein
LANVKTSTPEAKLSVSPVTEKKLLGMTKSGVTAPGSTEKPDVAIRNVVLAVT